MEVHTAPPIPLVLIGMVVLALFSLSLFLWGNVLLAMFRGSRWLPKTEPRAPQRWGVVDLLFVICLFIFLQIIGGTLASTMGLVDIKAARAGEPNLIFQFMMSAICSLAIVGGTVFIMARCRVPVNEVGWSLHAIGSDIKLGVLCFILVAPPTYILMALATKVSGIPYEHPIMSQAKETPSLLLPAIIMAVILAPLLEEFAFRVLIQGFLESMSIGRFSIEKFVLGRVHLRDESASGEILVLHRENGSDHVAGVPPEVALGTDNRNEINDVVRAMGTDSMIANPFLPTVAVDSTPTGVDESGTPPLRLHETKDVPWWPMVATGILFGLAHFSYGVSWVPLCVLGIALGWLYRATNRIWPCVVVHLCFNGFTMFLFAMHVLFGIPME